MLHGLLSGIIPAHLVCPPGVHYDVAGLEWIIFGMLAGIIAGVVLVAVLLILGVRYLVRLRRKRLQDTER